jgi:hypothetical protein
MQWDLDVLAGAVVLRVVGTGDYNGNGVVDAADYVVWRGMLGQTGPGLAADGNGNEIVDAADYDFWRRRFGNVIATGAGSVGAVPEPDSACLLAIGCVAALWYRRTQPPAIAAPPRSRPSCSACKSRNA